MKKIFSLLLLLFAFLGISAQNVQGIPYDGKVPNKVKNLKLQTRNTANQDFSFDDIKFWAGEGANRAALIVDWHIDDDGVGMVWGYKWDGAATGLDMIKAIAQADPRFLLLIQETNLGYTINGIGTASSRENIQLTYDLQGARTDSRVSFKFDKPNTSMGQKKVPEDPQAEVQAALDLGLQTGVINHPFNFTNYGYAAYDYDYWKPTADGVKWQSGWYNGYWSYLIKDEVDSDWMYSGVGALLRELIDGSIDSWGYQDFMNPSWSGVEPREPYDIVRPVVTFETTSSDLEIGADLQLSPFVAPASAVNNLVWTSNNTAVATVDNTGKVKAVGGGSATISLTFEGEATVVASYQINIEASATMSMNDIQYWIGSGDKTAAVVMKWNDGKADDALVWGYRWNGDVKAIDMLKDIAKADARFFILLNEGGSVNIGGIGFDLNGKNTTAIIKDGNLTYPLYPMDGLVKITTSDFDAYTITDNEDHWAAGIESKGIWNYSVMADGQSAFLPETESVLNKLVTDKSWNAWNFDMNLAGTELGSDFIAVTPYVEPIIHYTKGIFFVNEDWFGHANGSVNFLTDEGNWVYRAYSKENPNQAFGATTQYGTIYGDNFYFVSKQAADGGDTQYTPGGRLVVADAKTLKKKATFNEIGGGDGRSFLGVNDSTGYIGTSGGIVLFDIKNLTVGTKIEGTAGGSLYTGQIGTMLRIGDHVFACKQSTGIFVINAHTNEIITTIPFTKIGSIVQSKDGYLWATGYADGLWKIDPYTFEVLEKRAIPTAAQIPSSWGAWTSSLICASHETNTLYWAKMNGSTMTFFGTKVFKYDIDNPDLSSPFYELTGDKEAFYGSGMNIDPMTNNLVITSTKSGYGANYQYNWVRFVDGTTGELKDTKQLDNYYWFPAMSVFPKRTETVISVDLQETIEVKDEVRINLDEMISDKEVFPSSIIKTVTILSGANLIKAEIQGGYLVITPLEASMLRRAENAVIQVDFNAQGKVTSQIINLAVERIITGVESVNKDNIQAYVNNGQLIINGCTGYTFSLYNVNGQAIKTLNVTGDTYSEHITIPTGTYILKGKGRNGVVTKKIIF